MCSTSRRARPTDLYVAPAGDEDQVTVTWHSSTDPRDPYNWPARKKQFAIAIGLFASFVSSVNGTILSVAHQQINDTFDVSDETFPNSYLPTTSWGIGVSNTCIKRGELVSNTVSGCHILLCPISPPRRLWSSTSRPGYLLCNDLLLDTHWPGSDLRDPDRSSLLHWRMRSTFEQCCRWHHIECLRR